MFTEITELTVFHALMIMARVGTMFVVLPGFSESYIFSRARLWFAVGAVLLLLPQLSVKLPGVIPASMLMVLFLLIKEILIGFFMGISVRILFSALHSLGMMIAMHMGLASGSMFDPAQQSQGSEIGVLLSLTALAAAFAMDLHHAWLRGVVSSYAVFVPGEILPIADWSEFISQKTQESFALALQLSVPNLIVGFLIALVGGILARLMPQLNIFFISLPVQIAGGLITLIMFVSSMMLWFLARAEESALMWLPGGGM